MSAPIKRALLRKARCLSGRRGCRTDVALQSSMKPAHEQALYFPTVSGVIDVPVHLNLVYAVFAKAHCASVNSYVLGVRALVSELGLRILRAQSGINNFGHSDNSFLLLAASDELQANRCVPKGLRVI